LVECFASATGNFDIYIPFIEKGWGLLRIGGQLGMIVPNKFFKTDYGEGLRRMLSGQRAVRRIVDFGSSQVFSATIYTCLLFLKRGAAEGFDVAEVQAGSRALMGAAFEPRPSSQLSEKQWTFENEAEAALLAKLCQNAVRLLDLPAEMSRGSSTGDDEVFVVEGDAEGIESAALRIPVFASDFGRYSFKPTGKWQVIFPYRIGAG
jgi:adenine-specific DNA-methyltransferase